MELDAHCVRLLSSLQNCCFSNTSLPSQHETCIVAEEAANGMEDIVVKEALNELRNRSGFLNKLVILLINKALTEYLVQIVGVPFEGFKEFWENQNVGNDIEAKVTVLITYDFKIKKVRIIAHADKLVIPSTPLANVAIFGLPRESASVKDSNWVAVRADLEMRMPKGVSEIILCDPHGNVYEGTTSNFCAILVDPNNPAKYIVKTAPLDCVLTGTVLKIVEYCCVNQLGIEFRYEFPTLNELKMGLW
ncbi:hypothetical protein HK096_010822, partial [Nowakowskiella sp. JEL0078]